MSDLPITNYYTPPVTYNKSHDGAPEAGDFIPLQGSQSVILIGGLPIVGIENLSINETVAKTPIYTLGMLEALAFEQQNVSVTVSGTIVQNARMSLQDSEFYPKGPAEMAAFLNTVFDIEIVFQDATKPDNDRKTKPVWTTKNCQRTGSNLSIPNGKIIDSFTIIGTHLVRDFKVLEDYYVT